jgi:aspartate-semialdehyde dehydrogenase
MTDWPTAILLSAAVIQIHNPHRLNASLFSTKDGQNLMPMVLDSLTASGNLPRETNGMNGLRLAVIGATGLVGRTMLEVLDELQLPVDELLLAGSPKSAGKQVEFQGTTWTVKTVEEVLDARPQVALFSAGGDVSKTWAPRFAEAGTTVIDNSSAWRMDPDCPLVVPEVNGQAIGDHHRIIANPNCTTMQLVMALKPLHDAYRIQRGVVSTYQSITGTGKAAIAQLEAERAGAAPDASVYPHPIDLNCLPHCDVFGENGYTREEMKVWNETQKILGDESVQVTCTAVRVPVMGGHSESVYLEFEREFELDDVRRLLSDFPGIVVQDDPAKNVYPMPRNAAGKNEVFVGRIRRDLANSKGLHLWIVADNLRKGAATNTVQIAQYLLDHGRWSA